MLLHLALALPAPRAEEFNAPLVALAMPEPPPLARDNSHWQRRLFAAPANATVTSGSRRTSARPSWSRVSERAF